MTAVLEPRDLEIAPRTTDRHDGDLSVEISTAELVELEAELIFRIVDGPGLTDAERYRLVAIERELNRRWSLR